MRMLKSVYVTIARFKDVYGNSYFGGWVYINSLLPDSDKILIPYQYGYGTAPEFVAWKLINEKYQISTDKNFFPLYVSGGEFRELPDGSKVKYSFNDWGYVRKKDVKRLLTVGF